jgi:hypothetical protein
MTKEIRMMNAEMPKGKRMINHKYDVRLLPNLINTPLQWGGKWFASSSNRFHGFLPALALALGLATPAIASPDIAYVWQFSTAANPAAPESSTGAAGLASAAIIKGQLSDGWISVNAVLGSAQGVWDLGGSGSITLNNASGLAGSSDQERLITIAVTQYQDGGIYGQLANVSIPGAALVSSNAAFAASAYIGSWIRAQTQWRAPAGLAVNSILVAGVASGSLVDSLTLESSYTSAPAPQLTIRKVGPNNNQVEVSWPASSTNMVLEASSDLNNSQSWATVQSQVQVSGNVRFVTLDASGTASFYRLKQQ